MIKSIISAFYSAVKRYIKLEKSNETTLNLDDTNKSGWGFYGSYFNLQNGKGLKVLRSTESKTMAGALLSSERASEEMKTQQKARKILGDLVPHAFSVVPVEMNGLWYAAILMEHVEGQTLGSFIEAKYPNPKDEESRIAKCNEILNHLEGYMMEMGVEKSDNHEGNVIVTPDGKYKIIDWGLGAHFNQPDLLDKVG
jgi:RIO-like serine/threonine protein kinase